MGQYRKTTVEIDSEQLDKARAALRTDGIKETVNEALRQAGRRAALVEAADFVLAGKMRAPDLEDWADAREPRT